MRSEGDGCGQSNTDELQRGRCSTAAVRADAGRLRAGHLDASTRPLLDGSGEPTFSSGVTSYVALQRGRCSTAAVSSGTTAGAASRVGRLQRGRCSTAAVRRYALGGIDLDPASLQRGRCSTAAVSRHHDHPDREVRRLASTRPLLDGSGEDGRAAVPHRAIGMLQRGRCSTAAVRPGSAPIAAGSARRFNEAAARRQR